MNESSQILLLGVGGAGSRAADRMARSLDFPARFILVDTDASTGTGRDNFILLGGDRLSGAGSGGDVIQARLAAEDSVQSIDAHLGGVRLAVIMTCLGGGTGAGATLEITKHLKRRGIPAMVFATLPFSFEGEERRRKAIGVRSLIEEHSGVAFLLPMDSLVEGEQLMEKAMDKAISTISAGVTLFWRLLETPGYIAMDAERIRKLLSCARRGRFAFASAEGPERAQKVSDVLCSSRLLSAGTSPVTSILCGILAGDDLRLVEISRISESLRDTFGKVSAFNLATVNDEKNFSGKIEVVAMLFESDDARGDESGSASAQGGQKNRRKQQSALSQGPQGRGKFNNVEPTVINGEDMDVPTYVRRNINLEF